ncbi:MAG: helix-turn-helix domain-containing protein [Candidatus Omnitrophota bacterium]|jgi:excisionase family DNA binding protein
MAEEKLLTVRDVAGVLGISEKEVMELAESGAIPAYKVGGVYLRFKKEQIQEFRKLAKHPSVVKGQVWEKYNLGEKLKDFLYFNDFYLISALVIIFLLFIIFQGN